MSIDDSDNARLKYLKEIFISKDEFADTVASINARISNMKEDFAGVKMQLKIMTWVIGTVGAALISSLVAMFVELLKT